MGFVVITVSLVENDCIGFEFARAVAALLVRNLEKYISRWCCKISIYVAQAHLISSTCSSSLPCKRLTVRLPDPIFLGVFLKLPIEEYESRTCYFFESRQISFVFLDMNDGSWVSFFCTGSYILELDMHPYLHSRYPIMTFFSRTHFFVTGI